MILEPKHPARLLEEHLPDVRNLVAEWCRQQELGPENQAELLRHAVGELEAADYARVRAWRGRVAFRAYLAAAVPLLLEESERRRGEALLVASYDRVRSLCRAFANSRRLAAADAEELLSRTNVRLCDAGYQVMRRFRGNERQLTAYIDLIVRTTFIDGLVRRERGRFRPSDQARRLGLEAEMLEELIWMGGLTVREAVGRLRQEPWIRRSDDELAGLAAQLPVRERIQEQPIGEFEETAADPDGEARVRRSEVEALRVSFRLAFRRAAGRLNPEARLLLRVLFVGGLSVADSARALGEDQRPLYRVRDKALSQIRGDLEAAGFGWENLRPLVENAAELESWKPASEPGGIARPASVS